MDKTARDHLQRCFVLHRRDFSNTSLILEVFSGVHGRFPAIAKGAKRGRGATAAVLQPFQPLWLSWSGRGEVRTLVRSEPAGRAVELHGKALFCGFYLNELLVRLLGRADPHEDLFAFYHTALTALGEGTDLGTVLRQFELRLLQEIGYAVALDREADTGGPVEPDRRYRYEPESGLRVADPGDPGYTVSGETLLGLAGGEQLAATSATEAREFMRWLLAPCLGDRPLKSRELFHSLRGRPAS